METAWTVVSLLLSLSCVWQQAGSVQRDSLYPFGEFQGDQRLSIGDDISSSEIQLTTPIAFYDGTYRSIFINLNGHLSFETEIPVYKSDLILPIGFKVIAPFFADIDTRLSGNVYYRETQDPSLLEMATREITRNFPSAIGFGAQSLFIVTWDDVGYFKEQYDKTNTFQVVIASDGFDSFTFYHYVDDGLTWVKSQGKSSPVHEDVPAQAGFDAGDHRRSYTLPGSGRPEVQNLASWSNINVPGAWLFHIGLLEGSNIVLPPPTDSGSSQGGGDVKMTCSAGGARMCHTNAKCVDDTKGFCCQCDAGYFGNGFNCLQTGTPQRVNGRVSGTVNGIAISPVILHSYIVTSDGRAYTAISQLPQPVGNALQSVFTLGGVMGWLFALPSTPKSKNGYSITGGDFNRTAVVTYVSGGETLHIDEQFEGTGPNGYMRANTRLNGKVPAIPEDTKVKVDDYKEEYVQSEPGVIQVHSTHTFRVNEVPYRFKLDQTIKFKGCSASPPATDTQKLSVKRNFITFDPRENVVRYAQTNRITASVSGGADPCIGNTCGPNSQCVPDGAAYQCRCNRGYQGNGQTRPCTDIDECRTAANDCDFNARCYNTEGTFECRCNPGYRGDGRTCQRDLTCADVTCDVNARCVYDSDIGQPACECTAGYIGDGTTCQPVEFSCNEVNNCGDNAECLYDSASGKYICECVDGFSGDGFSCTDTGERSTSTVRSRVTTVRPTLATTSRGSAEINCRNCDVNAQCVYDVDKLVFRCQCKEGYSGDGHSCTVIDTLPAEDCSVLRNCDRNARCVFDDRIDEHVCVCTRGYRGDGYRCAPDDDCRVTNLCDLNAQCVFDPDYRRYSCQCNDGFEGDGRTCRQRVIACNQVNNCDINAECLYDDVTLAYACRCRPGFEGDGIRCLASNDCSRDPAICDVNARCVRQGNSLVCACNQGYRGDGRRCAPTGDTNSYLMYAQGVSIMQVPFQPRADNMGKQTLLIPGQTAVGIDVDCYSRYFYWTDISGRAISRARLDGTDSEPLITGIGSPEGVAVDWVARNMYWTDSGLDTIEVSKVDGTNRKTLFNTGLVNPRAIAVDPGSGLMFWSDWNRKVPKIEAAHMDGSGRRTLVETELGLPNGLTIDYRARQVCWADAGTMHIECINYDGRARRTVYALASYPFGLTLHNDIFYWTDWDMQSLPSIDKLGGAVNEAIKLPVGGNGKLYGLATVRDRCPGGSNACVLNNGGCRFLCLPTPNGGRTCACPDDIEEDECNRVNLLK